MATRIGTYTVKLDGAPGVLGFASVGSKRESEGPMAQYFDLINPDSTFGQSSWEKAESQMQLQAAQRALQKCDLAPGDIQYVFAGDLLNQCIGSNYGLRDLGIPFLGLYGACSTMAEGLALAGMMVEGGFADRAMAVTSSHFCSAERQFRFPLEYGGQRAPTTQWTATAAGAVVVGKQPPAGPYLREVCIGSIEDKDVKDIGNMGAAMAPAAALTLTRYFRDTGTGPEQYDLILTGDLGYVGSTLLGQLMEREGYKLEGRHADCGLLLYDRDRQDVHAGGSGCGCSAGVLCSYILRSMAEGKLGELLFMATGALMSTLSVQQGQNIPGVAHLVHLSNKPS